MYHVLARYLPNQVFPLRPYIFPAPPPWTSRTLLGYKIHQNWFRSSKTYTIMKDIKNRNISLIPWIVRSKHLFRGSGSCTGILNHYIHCIKISCSASTKTSRRSGQWDARFQRNASYVNCFAYWTWQSKIWHFVCNYLWIYM